MHDEANAWRVGQVTITRIVENEMNGLSPGFMFAGLTEERVCSIPWLFPDYADPEGTLRHSFHAYVIESLGRRILVDTCVGNDKPRAAPEFDHLNTPFLARLSAAGFTPESIDYVICTHMHVDHVGWNTRWDGVRWIPTFPNARYLFGRLEWEHWQDEEAGTGDVAPPIAEAISAQTIFADSVLPVIEAGLAELVETDHRITDEVSLFPTPGHTPGHVSVVIRSGDATAVVSGDVMHHPVQLADPAISANFDTDRTLAQTTRRIFIDAFADRDVLVLGTHFPVPNAGKIVSDDHAWRFAPVRSPISG